MHPVTYIGENRLLTRCKNGQHMVFDSRDRSVGLHLLLTGEHEPYVEQVIRQYLRPSSPVVIAGSNIGYFDVIAALWGGDRTKVHSFEANPDLQNFLVVNLEINGVLDRAEINGALSDKIGVVELTTLECHPGSGSIVSTLEHERPELLAEKQTFHVGTTTLDAYFVDEAPQLGLLKADVEGSETAIVRGGWELIKAKPPLAIILEHNYRYYDSKYSSMILDLIALGYKIECLLGPDQKMLLRDVDLSRLEYAEIICLRA